MLGIRIMHVNGATVVLVVFATAHNSSVGFHPLQDVHSTTLQARRMHTLNVAPYPGLASTLGGGLQLLVAQLGQQARQLQPRIDAVLDAHVAEADLLRARMLIC